MSLNGKTAASSDLVITNKAPWPDLSVQAFIDNFRLPAEYHQDLIQQQLANAVLFVNDHLELVADYVQPATLADFEQPEIAGTGVLVRHYQQAAMNCARAHLIWLFETVNRKDAAEVQGERSAEGTDYWMEQCFHHIDRLRQSLSPDTDQGCADGFRAGLV